MFDFSSMFGGSSGSSGMGSFNFSDYSMIKSGTYKKMMKSYYAEQSSGSSKTTQTSSSSQTKKTASKSVAEQIIAQKMHGTVVKDPTGLTQMQAQAGELKRAAEVFAGEDAFGEGGNYEADKVVDSVKNFINKYNSVLDQAGKISSKDVSQEVSYMMSMTKTMSKELEKLGITAGDDGKMTLNEDVLKNAHMDSVKAIFSGKGTYAAEIADKAASIASAAFRNSGFYSGSGLIYSSSTSTYSDQA